MIQELPSTVYIQAGARAGALSELELQTRHALHSLPTATHPERRGSLITQPRYFEVLLEDPALSFVVLV
jgi:hypothetical protein